LNGQDLSEACRVAGMYAGRSPFFRTDGLFSGLDQVRRASKMNILLGVKFLQLQSQFPWSLSRLIALLRQQLFVYRDLWRWIESPFKPPWPLSSEDSPQLPFAWAS
jgi:hypothetical protein